MSNDVPGGAEGLLVPPAGVEKAGGATGRTLIEQLRASIRALEQVPVSLALPPALGTDPSHPACSLSSPPSAFTSPSPYKGEGGDGRWPSPGGGPCAVSHSDPLPNPPPFRGREWPFDQLKRGGLHEIRPETYRDCPAALGFALAVIALERIAGRDLVLWCLTKTAAREWGRPYGPGLRAFGLDPALFLIVETKDAESAAWALEEGLKSRALIAALAEIEIKGALTARRLGLAAQASCTPCLLLSDHRHANFPGTLTRWRVAARESGTALFDRAAPGAPSWQLTLERCRGEAPGRSFIAEFSHESFRLRLSAASCDRAIEARGKCRAASR